MGTTSIVEITLVHPVKVSGFLKDYSASRILISADEPEKFCRVLLET